MSELIDRYAAIDAIRKLSQDNGYIDMPHEYVTDAIRRLPSAQLKHDDITTSEQPKSDRLGVKTVETCTDTISRQAAIRIAGGYCHPANVAKELAKLPSVQPESTADAEFWRKRADYYSDMCSKLIADMGAGVKIEAVKIDETGITFTKKKPSAQPEIIACGDCKHWICHERLCGYWNHGVKPLMWCSQAERREE